MTGEPEKSLIFYWRDPPAEVTEPLSVIPMNALEPNGQNSCCWWAGGTKRTSNSALERRC